jgi:hypothetical protein
MKASPANVPLDAAGADYISGRRAGLMIHFTCDRCKRVIDPEHELRYVVRMEIEVVMDPIHEDEPSDDRDHLLEIDEILDRVDESDEGSIGDDIYQKRQYDLCPQCYRKVSLNPLGRERKATTPLGFSHN